MATVVLNAYSKDYPAITNRIRASIYLQSDPQALVASIIDTTAGHPARTWSFPGLPRNNYGFRMDEIDGAGIPISNLALFDVVPGELEGTLCRDDEQPQVDTTAGFTSGTNTFTFDGVGGTPNYVGWEIVPSELTGRGILVRGLDYSWDKTTATFVLLQSGDVFASGNYYNIKFDCQAQTAGTSYPTLSDFQTILVTSNYSVDPSDFGKKIIAEPAGTFMDFELPDISTVTTGRKLMIESGGTGIAAIKFKASGGDIINFLRGKLYMARKECLSIYKFTRSVGVHEWRVCDTDGNFASCGTIISHDQISSGLFNVQLLDGSVISEKQFARLYNEIVLNLPITQVVNFDDWATGNNKYFYSLANSSSPSNAGKFIVPDRRGLFERNNSVGKAGDYFTDQIKRTTYQTPFNLKQNVGSGAPFGVTDGNAALPPTINLPITIGEAGATETFPRNYLTNKYVLI